MAIFTTIIWGILVLMIIGLIIIIIKGPEAFVYVLDEFNTIKKYRARVRDGKVYFNYNTASKGGIAIEKNSYKTGKKKVYFYRDVDGVLLPVSDKKIKDREMSFDLSTSQEKLYETMALKNVIEKIDNTWWSAVKPYIGAFIIVIGAVIVSVVMIQQARHVEPVPQPEVELFNNVTHAMMDLVQSNQQLVSEISKQNNINKTNNNILNKPPR